MDVPDSDGLAGRVAIVTGGGAAGDGIGNGRAASILLARRGAHVVVVDRQPELAEHTVDMIEADGGSAMAVAADVTTEADCRAMVDAALQRFGTVDVLVNNVGVGSQGSVVDETLERWERVMRINVTSMMLASAAVIPAMVAAGGGAIVNISSIAALLPSGLTAYSTSKGAVISLTRAMASDHGRDGVRVNCIAPGPAYTPMVQAGGMSEERREARRRATVTGVEGTGWDIGNAVVFLASDHARWITGQTLIVDGGVTVRGPRR
jgi:NAD(P)-dependent dehydrogenase (short-subunit alcohol dehydrogenase family)